MCNNSHNHPPAVVAGPKVQSIELGFVALQNRGEKAGWFGKTLVALREKCDNLQLFAGSATPPGEVCTAVFSTFPTPRSAFVCERDKSGRQMNHKFLRRGARRWGGWSRGKSNNNYVRFGQRSRILETDIHTKKQKTFKYCKKKVKEIEK